MSWDGVERRSNVRMTGTERDAWFAELEAEISDAEVISRDITRMPLLDLLKNIACRPVRAVQS